MSIYSPLYRHRLRGLVAGVGGAMLLTMFFCVCKRGYRYLIAAKS
jgi:hypothetical protein